MSDANRRTSRAPVPRLRARPEPAGVALAERSRLRGPGLARTACRATCSGASTPSSATGPLWRRPATARSVIFLFMEGGPSHIDMFDPKPELNGLAGQAAAVRASSR